MASINFRQSIRFCVDAYGLERLLRLIQSVAHIVVAFPLLLSAVAHFIDPAAGFREDEAKSTPGYETVASTLAILLALKQQLGLTRRVFRTFRFLDAFNSAYSLAQSQALGFMSVVMILDIMARSFNGMYLLLETATLVDAMGIEGLRFWSPENETFLKVESQRSWFLALVSGGASCAIVLYQDHTERVSLTKRLEDEKPKVADGAKKSASPAPDSDSEQALLQKEKIRKRMAELDRRRVALVRKLTANVLDLALPGSVIGWVPAPSLQVGVCMFITSLLTGYDVWERCGREVRGIS